MPFKTNTGPHKIIYKRYIFSTASTTEMLGGIKLHLKNNKVHDF